MSVATSYAKALFDAARETKVSANDMQAFEAQFDSLNRSLHSSKETKVALFGPGTSSKIKAEIVTELSKKIGSHALVTKFMALLASKERLNLLGEIREAFSKVRVEAEGGVMGKIVSAEPLESGDVSALAQAFSTRLGKKVEFTASTDSNLLAGLKVVVNGVTYDGTLRSKLQRLHDRLLVNTETVH